MTPVRARLGRPGLVVNAFAGPGGWCEGLRLAGYRGMNLGIEIDEHACATGHAAGHTRVRADVASFPLDQLVGRVDGVIQSPPCPTFSAAGDGAGKVDTPNVYRLIADYAAGRTPGEYAWADDRSALTAQPMRWVAALRPRWVALEQVPPVLPIWQYTAEMLRKLGYATWCGVLAAEEYGVPQTRRRAILVASLDGPVGPPAPTHQRYVAGRAAQVEPDLFGDPLPLPVSMADALGWSGPDDGPMLVTAGRTKLNDRTLPRPAAAPAPTIAFGKSDMRWTLAPGGTATDTVRPRPATDPAHTMTGAGAAAWALRNGNQQNACTRRPDEPAGTMFFGQRANAVDWVRERPATTVCGDPRIWPPGHKVNADDRARLGAEDADTRYGDRAGTESVRVTVAEAAVLQSFRPDYPWQGTQTAQYRQVGDAVPPLLGAAVLGPLLAAADRVRRGVGVAA